MTAMISHMRGRVYIAQARFRKGLVTNGGWSDKSIRFECDSWFHILTVKTRPVKLDDFDNVVPGPEAVRAGP